ncbi:MAG: Uma2 family endonuclease [Isosphaeraceae bacterium]
MASTLTELVPRTIDQSVVLRGVAWNQYEAVLAAFPEQAGLRITYLDGRLTLLSPSYRHDLFAEALADLVKAVAGELGIVWHQAGHATFRHQEAGGVEGDKTFYFGPHADRMAGQTEIDLTTQPPPDLAVEVEVTHSADDAVAVWGRLGVTEVWRLDVNRWTLNFGTLQPDGSYRALPRSLHLDPLEPADVLSQLRRAEGLAGSRWVAQLRIWVRDVLLPRRNG